MADVNTIASYIYNRAQQMGVNPNLALGIARFEGLNPNTLGSATFGNRDARGYSFGPYQLFSGSPDPRNIAPGGMAYEFQKRFGSAPSRENWQQQVDFSLERIKNRGAGDWYAVRDQGGVDAITQKGAQFARQIGLGAGTIPTPVAQESMDTTQAGGLLSPQPMAPQPMAPPPADAQPKMVYSQDLGTMARRLGHTIAPDWIDPAQMIPQEQAQREAAMATQTQRDLAGAMGAFGAMQAAGLRQDALAQRPTSLLQPSIVRGQFRPIQPMRGLL